MNEKMKIRTCCLLLFFITTIVSAQTTIDKKAQEILKGVSVKYKTFKSIKANFSIVVENTQDQSKQEQKGTLYIKDQKYKLQIAGQDIISDGKTRWTFVKDANEVQIDNQKTDDNAITPSNIFTIYEKGWQSKYTGEQKLKNVLYQLVELIPGEGKSKNIFKVKLMINKLQKTISTAKILDKNGSIQTISVEKLVPDAAGDDSIYAFSKDKYPGAEVIDLR
jgi:outer membrane lipoprotein-sorting protein